MSARSMSRSLELAHRFRWTAVILTAIVTLACLWLLAADVLMQTSFGIKLIGGIGGTLGVWPIVDHTLRGVMGVMPIAVSANVVLLALALSAYVLTQYVFLGAGKGWRDRLKGPAQIPAGALACAALIASLITVAIAAVLLEVTKAWYHPLLTGRENVYWSPAILGIPNVEYTPLPGFEGLRASNHLWLSAAIILVAWPIWYLIGRRYVRRIDRRWDAADRLLATGGISYWLFVFSGLTLLASGLLQSITIGFDGTFWHTGAYTAMAVSLGCLLWTCGPISALLFVALRHVREQAGQCVGCGYDLRESRGACPECGRERDATAARPAEIIGPTPFVRNASEPA